MKKMATREEREQAAYEEYKADEARMEQKIKEEEEREEALSKNPEIKEYKIRVPLEKAVSAYMAEHDPNNPSNGSWKIDVEAGLFGAYEIDVRTVTPHFAQSGNYYDPKAQIDEFHIDEYFDQDEIDRQGVDIGDYPSEYTDEEVEEAIEYDLSIVRSAKRETPLEVEIYGQLTEKLIGKRIYHIEWI
jgi:hypothetical protein